MVGSRAMRLYSAKVTAIAGEVVRSLVAAGDIEAEAPREVEADVEAVLSNYLALEREVNERTKDLLERTGRGQSEFNRLREQVAAQKGIKIGEDTLDFLLDQVVEIFHHSTHVDEIFPEDVVLRRKMAPIFKKHMALEDSIEADVRAQLKHVQEGTRTWDIEYARVMEVVKRKKGLS
jgi:hypothetical protein